MLRMLALCLWFIFAFAFWMSLVFCKSALYGWLYQSFYYYIWFSVSKLSLTPRLLKRSPLFFPVIVWFYFKFILVMHLEFFLVYFVKYGSSLSFLKWLASCPNTFMKKPIFSLVIWCASLLHTKIYIHLVTLNF
jgi:hypothetical protein